MDWTWVTQNIGIPLALSVGGWLWHKIRGEKKTAQRSVLDDVVDQFVYEQLDRYPLGVDVETYLKNSRGYFEKYIWDVAQKRGIPRNKTTELLVHAAIERGGKLLAEEVSRLREATRNTRTAP